MPVRGRGLQSDKELAQSGLYDVGDGGAGAIGAHIRHTVAKWLPDMSLSARLSVFVALIVIGVVASVTWLETRSFERDIERELMDAARLGAQSAADNLAARDQPLDPLDIRDVLHDLTEADPVLDVLSVIETDTSGHLHVFTSTSTEERAEALDAAGRAIATGAPATDRDSTVTIFAMPVSRHAQARWWSRSAWRACWLRASAACASRSGSRCRPSCW